MGKVVCTSCGKMHGYCQEQHTAKEAVNHMDLGKHYDKATTGNSKFEKRPFLKAAFLPKKGNLVVKIDDTREAPRNMPYSDILVDISAGKNKWTWGLRSGFTLNALIDGLGRNSDKWKGKKLTLTRGGDKGQYVNVAQ